MFRRHNPEFWLFVLVVAGFGVLPPDDDPHAAIDPYAADRAYWRSMWYRPPGP